MRLLHRLIELLPRCDMPDASRRYADWKAPPADGGWLVWPEPARLLAETRDNARLLSGYQRVLLQNLPLVEVRRAARLAAGCPVDDIVVATGHQAELYHPGVWFKDVVIDAAAATLGGQALHLAVDTDQVRHLRIRYPGVDLPVSDDPRLAFAAWSGQVGGPSPAHLQFLEAAVGKSLGAATFRPILPEFLAALRDSDGNDLARQLTSALLRVDRGLGMQRRSVIASDLWLTEAFAAFTHHVAANADRFADDYDLALNEYRAETGVSDPSRPMPNLLRTGDSVELPFWLDDLSTGVRTRPTVFRDGAGWVLQPVDRDGFWFDPRRDGWDAARQLSDYLRAAKLRLAPRALMLTLFARLCVVDQFVHGIGGGRYDQVTDRIVARHFGVQPPAFAVATATLWFPTAVGRQRTCLPCVLQEGHRLRHALPGGRKRELVAAIAAAPRRSSTRARLFQQMHRELAESPQRRSALEQWRLRVAEAQQRALLDQEEFSRELFYAVQPRERLAALIDALGAALSA